MSQLLLATTQLTPPPEVFLYIRMSTTEQLTGDSLRRQRDLGTLYAEQNNLVLPEHNILQDIGLSAYTGVNLQKGELGLFMERLQLGKIKPGSFLLVESIDRLSRQSIVDALSLFCELLQRGLVIVTLSDGRKHSKESTRLENILTSTMTISRANEESVMKSVRGSESWKNKRANAGIKKLTRLCSKWMIPDSKLTCFQLIPDRADIVRRIFREARSGLGAYKIASRLNAEKIPTFGPSKGWAKSSVTKILKSGAVIGEFQPHQKINGKRIPIGDPIQNYFPSIVSKQDFDLVQVEKAARRTAGVGRKGRNGYQFRTSHLAPALVSEPARRGAPGLVADGRGRARSKMAPHPVEFDMYYSV